MIRAFLAVEVSEDFRTCLVQLQEELQQRLSRGVSRGVRISWTPPSSIHLTVKFLGDIDEQVIVPLRDGIAARLKTHPAVWIPIERLGAFPDLQQPRVLWVGPSGQWHQGEDAKQLAALHQAVEGCCESLGLAPDARPLSPHLTVARIKAGERQVGQVLARSGIMDRPLSLGLSVGSVVLMQSELRPTGSVYTKLWEALVESR
jgi:2'-5' RNA ligase